MDIVHPYPYATQLTFMWTVSLFTYFDSESTYNSKYFSLIIVNKKFSIFNINFLINNSDLSNYQLDSIIKYLFILTS